MSAGSESSGKTILLNGSAASGKTSLSKALQETLDEPYYRWGVDEFYAMVPSRWAGGPRGELSHDGIFYEGDVGKGRSRRVSGIGYGPVGRQMLIGMHRAFHAFAMAGNNQIIDGLFWDKAILADFVRLFVDLEVLVVGVCCDDDVLERREAERGGPYGLALGQESRVHDEYHYDVTVDSTHRMPEEGALLVATWLKKGAQPHALKAMYGDLMG